MAQAEQPERLRPQYQVSVDDVRQLMGASTPHFALQLRNRIRTLIAGLPEDDPARRLGEVEIARLERLGVTGEIRGEGFQDGQRALPRSARTSRRRAPRTNRAGGAPRAPAERAPVARAARPAAAPARTRAAARRGRRPASIWASRIASTTLRAASACGPRPPDARRAIRRSARMSRGTTQSLPEGEDGRAPD